LSSTRSKRVEFALIWTTTASEWTERRPGAAVELAQAEENTRLILIAESKSRRVTFDLLEQLCRVRIEDERRCMPGFSSARPKRDQQGLGNRVRIVQSNFRHVGSFP
jgi:hypothetical protein